MALKPVAVTGDASAEAGTTPYTGATRGDWTAGGVSETSYSVLTSGDTEVIHKAECTFSFVGDSAPPQTVGDVIASETVTLEAAGTTLQGSSTFVLVDGDTITDAYGNTVSVSASAPLRAG